MGLTLAFVHDHRFIPQGDRVYSETGFGRSLWTRYLETFDELLVIGRTGTPRDALVVSDLERSDMANVTFALQPNLAALSGRLGQARAVRRRMRTLIDRCDAVVARVPSELGLMAMDVSAEADRPCLAEIVGCPWDALTNYGSLKGKLYAPIQTRHMKRRVRDTPFALYVTERFLQSRYPANTDDRISISDVDLGPLDPDVLRARRARIAARGPDDPLTFGIIGSLTTRVKGIQTILPALRRLRQDGLDARLRILGGGDPAPWRAEAERRGVARSVRFDGVLPGGAAVRSWLDEVDIYLQPSLQEGLPRALIEALSRACPAIGTRVAGIPEILGEEMLVAPNNVQALTSRMGALARDPDAQRRQAEKNFRTAKAFEAETLAARRRAFMGRFAEEASRRTEGRRSR